MERTPAQRSRHHWQKATPQWRTAYDCRRRSTRILRYVRRLSHAVLGASVDARKIYRREVKAGRPRGDLDRRLRSPQARREHGAGAVGTFDGGEAAGKRIRRNQSRTGREDLSLVEDAVQPGWLRRPHPRKLPRWPL